MPNLASIHPFTAAFLLGIWKRTLELTCNSAIFWISSLFKVPNNEKRIKNEEGTEKKEETRKEMREKRREEKRGDVKK